MTELLRRSGHAEAYDETGDAIYRLQGYLNHRGKSAHVGHYTASVAYANSKQRDDEAEGRAGNWFEFDDAVVSDMAKADAAKERSHGKKIRSRDIYMLLYVRDNRASGTDNDCARNGQASEVPYPSETCQEQVEALNIAFDAEVEEYTSRASGMETRIQKRVDAYKRFFEKSQPYPDASATEFYWVDSEWLRRWVAGEENDNSVGTALASSHVSVSKPELELSNGKTLEKAKLDPVHQSGDQNENDDDNCIIINSPEANSLMKHKKSVESADSTTESECSGDGESSRIHDDGDVEIISEMPPSASPMHTSPGVQADTKVIRSLCDDDIPFVKPADVSPFCCPHSSGLLFKVKGVNKEGSKPVLRFAPGNAPKLKRISAKLYAYLLEDCGLVKGDSTPSASVTPMRVFEAPTYRCTICEKAFRNKLLTDVDRLNEVNEELQLLKGSPSSISAAITEGGAYLISRAWVKSYKLHLQKLHKELSHPSSMSKKKRKSLTPQDDSDYLAPSKDGMNGNDTTSGESKEERDAWQKPINEDITCVHGNLTLEKRTYRPVSAETWSYFSSKFPCHAEYTEADADVCPQCQVDDMVSKECIQVERDVRDEVLSVAALDALFRRKPKGKSIRLNDVFELPAAHRGTGLEKASSWTKRDAALIPRRMFLVSRQWLSQWREYIRNVEEASPPSLSLSSLLCSHQKLVLPPALLAAQQGHFVDASSLEVEFVSLGEMLALVERYGDPEVPFYYGLLIQNASESEEKMEVVWRQCSLASLQYGHESALNKNGCPNGVVPLVCEDANDEGVTCTECQASSDQRHRDELENFSNRVVNVQQLSDDQAVPISENLTFDANAYGRRRSRRIRPGSASTWPVTANATDTVCMLKSKIYAEIDALPIRQRLYYKGKVLDDYRTLKQCGIKAGDAVFMRLSEDNADDLVVDETQEREIGFADSVFLSHPSASAAGPDTSGDQAMAMALSNSHETRVWVCPACTFVNDDTDSACEMCSTTKTCSK
ncbi:unnamed protein product [Phytophthora fragariaefolia]|uniref:Unnamed protein product n=1 Tax=Phytophthora fragariaefolia TaxID=1490495 RepID=A0A9W7CLL1_9STRA|nr:unnamed protein product [Phytophthora fragariaefolia]